MPYARVQTRADTLKHETRHPIFQRPVSIPRYSMHGIRRKVLSVLCFCLYFWLDSPVVRVVSVPASGVKSVHGAAVCVTAYCVIDRELTQWSVFLYHRCFPWMLCLGKCCHYTLYNPLFTYHQFNIQQSYVVPTQCIYVFCVDLRTNSDYLPIQHWLTGLYNRDLTV